MYGVMGSKSNTMIFSDKPADINALLAQASTIINSTKTNNPLTSLALNLIFNRSLLWK